MSLRFFFFNDTATTEIYTLSLHDALPIYDQVAGDDGIDPVGVAVHPPHGVARSEEHTSELQSHSDLVCRLLLEKKKEKRLLSRSSVNLVTKLPWYSIHQSEGTRSCCHSIW